MESVQDYFPFRRDYSLKFSVLYYTSYMEELRCYVDYILHGLFEVYLGRVIQNLTIGTVM